ncbi:MAG: pilin [bacterium]|nr:pilin [bacterium]
MKKNIKQIFVASLLLALIAAPYLAAADSSALENLKNTGESGSIAPYAAYSPGENDIASIIGLVIQAFLGLLGVIFLIYVIYAGYNWMTAQGDEEKVTKAKDTLTRAIIGIIITVAAYAISAWVFDKLVTGTGILQ